MASLEALKKIQTDSTADPGGDPDAIPPVPPDPAIVAARSLLGKIEVALWKEIQQRLAGTDPTLPPGTPPEEQNRLRNEAIGWGQRELPKTASLAQDALKVFLAFRHDQTVADILNSSDNLIENAMNALVPRLSIGFHPGRR